MSEVNPFHSKFRRDFDSGIEQIRIDQVAGGPVLERMLGLLKLLADEIEKCQQIPEEE